MLKTRVRTSQDLIKESFKYVKFFSSLSNHLVDHWGTSLDNLAIAKSTSYEELETYLEKLSPLKKICDGRVNQKPKLSSKVKPTIDKIKKILDSVKTPYPVMEFTTKEEFVLEKIGSSSGPALEEGQVAISSQEFDDLKALVGEKDQEIGVLTLKIKELGENG